MKSFYIKLVGIVIVSALIITGLAVGLIHIRAVSERNPLRYDGFRRYLLDQIRELGPNPGTEAITSLAQEYSFHIQVLGPKVDVSTEPNYFRSATFNNLQVQSMPNRSHRRRPEPNRPGPPNRHRPEFPRMTGLFDGDTLVGLQLMVGENRWILVNAPPDLMVRLLPVLLILGIGLVFIGLAIMVKRWFIDPLNRLEKAISAFAVNMDTADTPMPGGQLEKLFRAFNDMKRQVSGVMADKERLLRDVSHDLKSPITRMRMAVELLDESRTRELLVTNLADLNQLVTKILESQEQQSFRNEIVDVELSLRRFLGSREFHLPIRLQPRVNFSFLGNETQLHRVFVNLIDNAEKYADREQGLDIEVTRQDHAGLIRFIDHGGDVAEGVLAKMFEPFYKSDNSRRQDQKSGFGLGLPICKQIVETMGGHIGAGPTPGGGLTVEISFPEADTAT